MCVMERCKCQHTFASIALICFNTPAAQGMISALALYTMRVRHFIMYSFSGYPSLDMISNRHLVHNKQAT